MRKFSAAVIIAVFILSMTAVGAFANESQTIEVKIADVIENYALKTNWGNAYFQQKDIRRLTHAAAKMQPINLGDFRTDHGDLLLIHAIGYKTGNAVLLIKKVK